MYKFIPLLLSSLFAISAYGQATEAMKSGDPQAEAAAQAKVDARQSMPSVIAHQPEANRHTNERAVKAAEARKAKKPKIGTKNSTAAQMARDRAKL